MSVSLSGAAACADLSGSSVYICEMHMSCMTKVFIAMAIIYELFGPKSPSYD